MNDTREISSGLGIGGYGSDDYNIQSESPQTIRPGRRERHHNAQLWENCPTCGREPVGHCGYCERHCQC